MKFQALQAYLERLKLRNDEDEKLWVDEYGRVQGRFRDYSLTSVFQAIIGLADRKLFGFEAFLHSDSTTDSGLSLWQLLMNGATDDESVALDRLARTIHVINFFRQQAQEGHSALIDVHDRLLTAIGSHHGMAFRRIISSLGLPQEKIILQLPAVNNSQSWALAQVVDNYKLSGFSVVTRATSIDEAIFQINLMRPSVMRIDMTRIGNGEKLTDLIDVAAVHFVKLVFARVEHPHQLSLLSDAAARTKFDSHHLLVQGPLFSAPTPEWAIVDSGSASELAHEQGQGKNHLPERN